MIKRIFIQENYLPTFVNIVLGGREGGEVSLKLCPKKITIVVPNDSLVIFWTVFTSVPTTFDLHCLKVDYVKEIMFVVYFCTKKGALVGINLS